MKKILFISHDAYRAGAPIVLLNFLRWFKEHGGIPFSVLIRECPGVQAELLREFKELAPTYIFHTPEGGIVQPLRRVLSRYGLGWERGHFRSLRRSLAREDFGLVFSNTAVNGDVLEFLAPLECPVISHIHELEYWIRYRVGPEDFARVMRHTRRYIAVSRAVRANLVDNFGVPEEAIDLVYETVPAKVIRPSAQVRTKVRAELNIPDNAVVVGGSGTTDWRKGPDLFLQVALQVRKRNPEANIHFVWVGGESEGPVRGMLMHDVTRAGLGDRIHLTGVRPNPFDYFSAFDIFAMTSREDPFPLVMMESGALGIPLVCFAGSGGAEEYVEGGCGTAVPYLDTDAMAKVLVEWAGDAALRKRMGETARAKVDREYDVEVNGPKILEVIRKTMEQ